MAREVVWLCEVEGRPCEACADCGSQTIGYSEKELEEHLLSNPDHRAVKYARFPAVIGVGLKW